MCSQCPSSNHCIILGEQNVVHDINTKKKKKSYYSRRCFAGNCSSTNHSKDIRLFKFPENEDTRKKWIDNLNVDSRSIRKYMYACQFHFSEKYWTYKVLPKTIEPLLVPKGNRSKKYCN